MVKKIAAALPNPRTTPFTFWYLVLLLATTAATHVMGPDLEERVLTWSSSDVHHLLDDPGRALAASALWAAGGVWSPYFLAFSLVLAPVERRVGGLRVALIFASGHVLATLATELPIAALVHAGSLPGSSAFRVDVGVSFGLYATAGALIGLLNPRLRPYALLIALLTLSAPVLQAVADAAGGTPDIDTVALVGHSLSLLIGIAWWPRLRVLTAGPESLTAPLRS
jgi:hypothetical protein